MDVQGSSTELLLLLGASMSGFSPGVWWRINVPSHAGGDYGPTSSRMRRDYALCQSSNTAIAGFDRGTKPNLQPEPQNRREVEEEGRLYMLVAIDRTSKFAFAELRERVTERIAGDFLRRVIDAVPYKIHTVLTDNGTHFKDPQGDGWTAAEVKQLLADKTFFRCHAFVLACAQNSIDHRLTKPNHPWNNGQVECMNRTGQSGENFGDMSVRF